MLVIVLMKNWQKQNENILLRIAKLFNNFNKQMIQNKKILQSNWSVCHLKILTFLTVKFDLFIQILREFLQLVLSYFLRALSFVGL